jgi:hypothetical protein
MKYEYHHYGKGTKRVNTFTAFKAVNVNGHLL